MIVENCVFPWYIYIYSPKNGTTKTKAFKNDNFASIHPDLSEAYSCKKKTKKIEISFYCKLSQSQILGIFV